MPKLRNLDGREIVRILVSLGFEVVRIKGSHHQLRMKSGETRCFVTVPVHKSSSIPPGTLKSIIRQASPCVSDEAIRSHFYTD